jgi:hypothetical protein
MQNAEWRPLGLRFDDVVEGLDQPPDPGFSAKPVIGCEKRGISH